MPLVERSMRADKGNGLAHRDTDAAAFDDYIVLESTYQPDARRVLNDEQAKALMSGRRQDRSSIRRPRAIGYTRRASILHTPTPATPVTADARPQESFFKDLALDGSGSVVFQDEQITQGN